MLYTPLPGTPLTDALSARGLMLDESECPLPDTHGQHRFNYRHPHLKPASESELIVRAFQRDFAVNGPSMVRVIRTTLAGWKRYRDHPDPRIRRRFHREARGLATTYTAVVAATRRYYRNTPALHATMSALLGELIREFGWRSRVFATVGGWYVFWKIRQEEKRLAQGWTYEPPTFYEINDAVAPESRPMATQCRYVTADTSTHPCEEPAPSR